MNYTSPPDPAAFNAQVWATVHRVPSGRVVTYGQVAALLPPPPGVDPAAYRSLGARWVGGAMASCPSEVPWHRVVNAQGRISPRRGRGPRRQRELLEREGVLFDETDRIDLDRFRWRPEEDHEK